VREREAGEGSIYFSEDYRTGNSRNLNLILCLFNDKKEVLKENDNTIMIATGGGPNGKYQWAIPVFIWRLGCLIDNK